MFLLSFDYTFRGQGDRRRRRDDFFKSVCKFPHSSTLVAKQTNDPFNNLSAFTIPDSHEQFSGGRFFPGLLTKLKEKDGQPSSSRRIAWNAIFGEEQKPGLLSRPPLFGVRCTKTAPLFFSTKPRSTFHSVYGPVAQPCPRIGQTDERNKETRRRGRVIISRCNRYDLSPGVVRHLRARRARWMVNVKPRVSLAWPSRRLDHNAWSCRSQADYNHGDPTFYRHRGSPSFLFYATLPLVARAFSR